MELHGFLAIDKPLGWTSHDVVAFLRKRIGVRRIGHAGTLDPSATGVLIAGVGRATRFLDYVQHGEKEYLAHVVLGAESTTADVDGTLTPREVTVVEPGEQEIQASLSRFIGTVQQIPPKYSAIKKGGEPLYRLARRGEPVDVAPRSVRIASIELLRYAFPDLVLHIRCSPGTYIRSIARDIGDLLGCGGYLHHLVRTRSGPIRLDECWTIEQLSEYRVRESWTLLSVGVDVLLSQHRAVLLNQPDADAWYHGRSIQTDVPHSDIDEIWRGFTIDGTFAGIATINRKDTERATLRPRIVLGEG